MQTAKGGYHGYRQAVGANPVADGSVRQEAASLKDLTHHVSVVHNLQCEVDTIIV